MKRSGFLIIAGAGVLTGCSSVSVNRDYDSTFDFSVLKTFAWQNEEQPQTGVPRIDNDLNDKRIRAAVENDLRAKGFQLVEKSEATFLVSYFMGFQQRIDSTGSTMSVGVGRSTAGRAGTLGWNTGTTVSDYEEAQLTIDMLKPDDEQMFWRGRGRRRTSSNSNPEKITARTNEAVTTILKKFPPQPKRR